MIENEDNDAPCYFCVPHHCPLHCPNFANSDSLADQGALAMQCSRSAYVRAWQTHPDSPKVAEHMQQEFPDLYRHCLFK